MQRKILLINVGLVVVLLAGGLITYLVLDGSGASAAGKNTRTTTVQRGTVTATVSAAGTVEPSQLIGASFGTSGTVAEIDVKVGQQVNKGDTLAKLDPSAAQRQLNVAKAQLTAAQDSLDNAEAATASPTPTANRAGSGGSGGSGSSVASAQAQVASAQAQVDADQHTLDACTLTAPIAGTVLAVNGIVGGSSSGSSSSSSSSSSSQSGGNGGNGGNGASGGSSTASTTGGFIVVADMSKLQVHAAFSETDVAKLKVGQTATVTFNALPNVDGTGAVAQIDPTSTTSNNVVQYGVTVSLDSLGTSADASLRPGQSATITVTTAEADNALWVPTQAVHTGGGSSTVTVLRNGKQVSVPVTLGVQGDRQTQISSGLSQGEQVVLTIATTSNGNLGNTGRFGGNGNRLGGTGGTLPGGTLGGGR